MDLDSAKENIQPLASGRNIHHLETALNADSDSLLLQQRQEHENAVRSYSGPDPLCPWYEYIMWVEQSFPKSGKESALDDLVQKCLLEFESDDRYKQDARMVKLYIKYIDSQPNPLEHFQTLYNQGVGTRVADLYLCWAYYYDIANNYDRANAVYRMGLDAHAEPRDVLERAHKQFGFSMSQRLLLNQDDAYRREFQTEMEERRSALTSLRTHRHKYVGSIRTGDAIRSHAPGRVQQMVGAVGGSNAKVKVFEENRKIDIVADGEDGAAAAAAITTAQSVVQSIMDSSKKKENFREPGPWSKANKTTAPSNKELFANSAANCTLAFPIALDTDDMDAGADVSLSPIPCRIDMHAKGIRLPPSFIVKNIPQTDFTVASFGMENIVARSVAGFDKIMLFPKPNKSFDMEELTAYRWFKRRHIRNAFTVEQDKFWLNTYEIGIRLPPLFAAKNEPQEPFTVARYIEDDSVLNTVAFKFQFNFHLIYPDDGEERCNEELLEMRWKRGECRSQIAAAAAAAAAADQISSAPLDAMDETMVVTGRQSICHGAIRKSIVAGGRKSIMPSSVDRRTANRKSVMPPPPPPPQTRSPCAEEKPNTRTLKMFSVIKTSISICKEEREEDVDEKPPTTVPKQLSESAIFGTSSILKADQKVIPSIFKSSSLSSVQKPEDTSIKPASPPVPDASQRMPIVSSLPSVPLGGVTRKSICPSKRKTTPINFDFPPAKSAHIIDEDNEPKIHFEKKVVTAKTTPEASGAAAVPPGPAEPSPFQIFEDSTENCLESPEKKGGAVAAVAPVVFKTPHQISAPRKSVFNINDDDETFSTQNFNCFIRSNGVSTPVAAASKSHATALQTIEPPKSPSETYLAPSSSSTVATAAAAAQKTNDPNGLSPIAGGMQPRQLSTIMETTESNTLSSATTTSSCTTKSSVDTQFVSSSPENENEFHGNSRRQTTTTTPTVTIQPPNTSPPTKFNDLSPEIISSPAATYKFPIYEDFVETQQKTMTTEQLKFVDDRSLRVFGGVAAAAAATEDMTVPSMCPIQIYEDHTETVPMISNMAAKINAPPPPEQKSIRFMNNTVGLADFTLPPIGPIEDDAEATVPMKSVQQQAEPVEELNPPTLAMSAIHIFEDECSPPPSLPRKSTFETSVKQPTNNSMLFKETKKSFQFAGPSSATTNISMPKLEKLETNDSIEEFFGMTEHSPAKKSFAVPDPSQKPSNVTLSDLMCTTATTSPTLLRPLSHHNSSTMTTISSSICSSHQSIIRNIKTVEQSNTSNDSMPVLTVQRNEGVTTTFEYPSIHIKMENISNVGGAPKSSSSDFSSIDEIERSIFEVRKPIEFDEEEVDDDDDGVAGGINDDNLYIRNAMDLNETRQIIDAHLENHTDPFDTRLQNAFLEQHVQFPDYLNDLGTCEMVNVVRLIRPNTRVSICDRKFDVKTLVGKGNYGKVFRAKCVKTGVEYALKQERPANLWEYYICLELQSRIENDNILQAIMNVDCSLIGNNASILVSQFGTYGTMIDVCNRFKQSTNETLSQFVVMLFATQMLAIIDHLHASKIIHADIKPDNWLLMRSLTCDQDHMVLKLIDFGQSIDLSMYPSGQTFTAKVSTSKFICIEMLTDRPWTFQTDLFCVASTIHTFLFGTYMDVLPAVKGYRMRTAIPRYMKKNLWEHLFDTLINIPNCDSLPNLQNLRGKILQTLSEHMNTFRNDVTLFNTVVVKSVTLK